MHSCQRDPYERREVATDLQRTELLVSGNFLDSLGELRHIPVHIRSKDGLDERLLSPVLGMSARPPVCVLEVYVRRGERLGDQSHDLRRHSEQPRVIGDHGPLLGCERRIDEEVIQPREEPVDVLGHVRVAKLDLRS